MTLSDMLSRDLHIEWHEAVALVRDIIDRAQGNDADLPDLHQVDLLRSGQVDLLGGEPTTDQVGRINQLLQALLAQADPPVQLRLLLVQGHETLDSYSGALAFFERPDRVATLQALYNRATSAPPLRDPAHSPEASTAPAVHLPQKPAPEKGRAGRNQSIFAAGIIALVIALGVAVMIARKGEGATEPSVEQTPGVSQKLGAAVESAVAAVGSAVGLTGAAGDASSTPAPDLVLPAPRKPGARQARSEAAGSAGTDIQRAALSAFDLTLPAPAARGETEAVTIVATAAEPDIYSASSPGVSAPIGIRPQLPKELPRGVQPEDLTQIELTILPDGTVDSVKLLGQTKTVHAFMLLSAAKAWQFHPAMKDGLPVKYRKTIWVAR